MCATWHVIVFHLSFVMFSFVSILVLEQTLPRFVSIVSLPRTVKQASTLEKAGFYALFEFRSFVKPACGALNWGIVVIQPGTIFHFSLNTLLSSVLWELYYPMWTKRQLFIKSSGKKRPPGNLGPAMGLLWKCWVTPQHTVDSWQSVLLLKGNKINSEKNGY